MNGTSTFFNTEGRMYATNFYYYGLKAGPATFLEKGVLKRYSFYSLENELLFRIDYDSVQGKKITDMERHFFNFHLTQADEFYEGKITVNQQLCFLYLLNPPKYRFNYSLVQIDRSYNVLSVLQEFESVNPWVKFKIKPEFSTTSRVALKLNICDSINGMEGEMFKVIDN